MTEFTMSGMPVLIIEIGTMVVTAMPIWLGAKAVGAGKATLLRAMAAIVVAVLASIPVTMIAGGLSLILVPLTILLSFKYILDTSLTGALMLSVIAVAIYFAEDKLIGGSISITS